MSSFLSSLAPFVARLHVYWRGMSSTSEAAADVSSEPHTDGDFDQVLSIDHLGHGEELSEQEWFILMSSLKIIGVSLEDEWVQIQSSSPEVINMGGFVLTNDGKGQPSHQFTFPHNFSIQPRGTVTVYCAAASTHDHTVRWSSINEDTVTTLMRKEQDNPQKDQVLLWRNDGSQDVSRDLKFNHDGDLIELKDPSGSSLSSYVAAKYRNLRPIESRSTHNGLLACCSGRDEDEEGSCTVS